MRKNLLRIGLPLAILAIGLSFAGYLRATRPQLEPRQAQERVWTVAAVAVEIIDARPEMRLYGEIVSGRTIDLRPKVSGTVVLASPALVEGGVVRKGEVLIAIDRFDYESAVAEREAELAEAKAQRAEIEADLAGARALLKRDKEQEEIRTRDVQRRERLRGSGAGSVKALDDAKLAASEAVQRRIDREKSIKRNGAEIKRRKAVVDRLEVALKRARHDLEDTRIVSPFDGFIVGVETAEGKWVNTGDKIAGLIDAGRLEAKFHVNRTRFRRLQEGGGYNQRDAKVLWRGRAGAAPWDAVIERTGGEVDPASGGVNLYARIKIGGAETVLRPGAFVEVAVPDRIFEKVVRLPAAALHDGAKVYAVVGERLEARAVEFVARDGGGVLIRGNLEAGDRIVTTRFPEIGPGLKVRVQ